MSMRVYGRNLGMQAEQQAKWDEGKTQDGTAI